MDFFEALDTRRSIRTFRADPVPQEAVDRLLRAGTLAPSAMNKQPWDFVVVTERRLLDDIAARHPYAKFATQAPLAIVVCGTPNGTDVDFWQQDCAAATQNILLAARALGIASVWCGLYPVLDRAAMLRAILGIPEEKIPMSLIVLGYSDKEFTTAHRNNPAKIHYNAW